MLTVSGFTYQAKPSWSGKPSKAFLEWKGRRLGYSLCLHSISPPGHLGCHLTCPGSQQTTTLRPGSWNKPVREETTAFHRKAGQVCQLARQNPNSKYRIRLQLATSNNTGSVCMIIKFISLPPSLNKVCMHILLTSRAQGDNHDCTSPVQDSMSPSPNFIRGERGVFHLAVPTLITAN